ncbi:MAG TPA: hypothetical protein DD435_10590 [Cyanobacteria bacterium UBA8530]|nr:hypothetical protein [Cyanobacteria bacterium UBA8530]
MAGSAYAQANMGDFSQLTDVVGADSPPFQAQMLLDANVGQDRVMNIYYVPGKIRIEGASSRTAYIARTHEKMYYVNFEGNSWVKMPMGANASPVKTGIEELDEEIFKTETPRYTTRKLGSSTFDGKPCDVTEILNENDGRTITTWEWKTKHVPLKVVTKERSGQASKVLFQNFKFTTPPASLFLPPKGAKVMSVQELTRGMSDGDMKGLKGLDSLKKGLGNDE